MTLVNAALMALGTTGAEIYSGTGIPVRPGDSGRLYDMAGSREHYGEGWERLWVLAGFRIRRITLVFPQANNSPSLMMTRLSPLHGSVTWSSTPPHSKENRSEGHSTANSS